MKTTIAALLILIIALPAFSAGVGCRDEETLGECSTRRSNHGLGAGPVSTPDAIDKAKNETREEVKQSNSGLDTDTAATASATKNFLPLLRFAGLVGDGDVNEDGIIALDYNFGLPIFSDHDRGQIQALLNPSPDVFKPLLESASDEQKKALEDDLDDFDDIQISFSFSKSTEQSGREFAQYRSEYGALADALLERERLEIDTWRSTSYLDMHDELAAWADNAPAGTPHKADIDALVARGDGPEGLKFSQLPEELRARYKEYIEDFSSAENRWQTQKTQLVTGSALSAFSKLVANNDQYIAQINVGVVDDLVGPDTWGGKLSWEKGLTNMTSFYKKAGKNCRGISTTATSMTDRTDCLQKFEKYVKDNQAAIDNSDRVAFSLEYEDVDDYEYTDSGLGIDFKLPDEEKLIGSLAYSRSMPTGGLDRMDLLVKYEDVSDDDTLNDRWVATLTLSRRVGDTTIPLSLVYSNKGEFATDNSGEVSINIGMAFDALGL